MISAAPQPETVIQPRELYSRLQRGEPCDLIDVRTAPEHFAAHVPGARLLPLTTLDARSFLNERLRPDAPLYVICQSGARAAKAVEKFQRAGFYGCVLVEGGTQAWIDAGLPVERQATRVWPLMRQVQVVVGLFAAAGSALALFVHPWFAVVPLLLGCGLLFAGVTGSCGLALFLARMPWNRPASCSDRSCCN